MCIFSAEIDLVRSTKIWIACNPEQTQQVLIYQNVVQHSLSKGDSQKVPAMLLALPVSNNLRKTQI